MFCFPILLSHANITNNYYYKTTKLLVKNNIINNSRTNESVKISNRYLLAQYENQTKNHDYKKGFDLISKYENQTKYGKQPQNHKEAYNRGVDMVSKGNSKGWIYIIIGSIGYAVKLFYKHKK